MGADPPPSSVVAMIGDVVASRTHPDRASLQDRLATTLAEVNRTVPAVQPLQITIGDEFQGVHATLADAVSARVLVDIGLMGWRAVRVGLGIGTITVTQPGRTPFGQDGPAWWAARAALDDVAERGRGRRARPHVRTGMRLAEDQQDPGGTAVAAALLPCLDHLLGEVGGDPQDQAVLAGVVAGRTLGDIGTELGISHQAVSARARGAGVYAIAEALATLRAADDPP